MHAGEGVRRGSHPSRLVCTVEPSRRARLSAAGRFCSKNGEVAAVAEERAGPTASKREKGDGQVKVEREFSPPQLVDTDCVNDRRQQ